MGSRGLIVNGFQNRPEYRGLSSPFIEYNYGKHAKNKKKDI